MWLVTTERSSPAGATELTQSLAIGEALQPEDVYPPGDMGAVIRYTLATPGGDRDLREELEWKGSASFTIDDDGTHLIGMERIPSVTTLSRDAFEHYLAEEERLELLGDAGEKPELDERFSRHLKQIVQRGEEMDPTATRALGHRFEIVPLAHPLEVEPGAEIGVRVLFEGEPLAGLPVAVYARSVGGKVLRSSGRTGSDGIATLTLPGEAPLLFRAVHIRPAVDDAVDFESFWGSLYVGER